MTTQFFVSITWDGSTERSWLTRDYFPEFHRWDTLIFPSEDELGTYFKEISVEVLPVTADCEDGFLAAFWKRPAAYLSSGVRQSISSFARLENPARGLRKLALDLESGEWQEKKQTFWSWMH